MYLSISSVSVILLIGYDSCNGKVVRSQTETADDSEASAGNIRMMAELFTFVHVGDVNLNARAFQTPDAVLQGNTCMGIGTCIENYSIVRESHFL